MEIEPIRGLDATVRVPGSKSYTQRALIIAALAEGESLLRGPLECEDSGHLIRALRSLGAGISTEMDQITVEGTGGRISNPGGEIFLGNNGTALRLLTSVVSLGRGRFVLTGADRLCQRPMEPLLAALRTLGVDARSENGDGNPPVIVLADGLSGGQVLLGDLESSQYVSSLLIGAPLAKRDTVIELAGRAPSLPYVEMTVAVMGAFGVEAIKEAPDRYLVKAQQRYEGRHYAIEGDLSSASYFFAAAVVGKGKVRVENVNPATHQGDVGLLPILKKLGCRVTAGDHWVEVAAEKLKHGPLALDMGEMPDLVPTVSVLAALRPGRTVITHVGHLRVKESDRLRALATELNRVGVRAEEMDEGLVIHGGKPHGAHIETYNDHRIAMSFAILGLAVPGIRIEDEGCVNKSFPGFWEELRKLR
jgi:3-phosphoshikimate 1-carboxyvinyltransferase